MSKVSAIIPTLWKAKDFTDHLVDVLVEDISVGEIIIIDNAPTDFFYDYDKVSTWCLEENILSHDKLEFNRFLMEAHVCGAAGGADLLFLIEILQHLEFQ